MLRYGVKVGLEVTYEDMVKRLDAGPANMNTLLLRDGGEIVWDGTRIVAVGDRGLPERVVYRHSGDGKQSGLEIEITVRKGVPVTTRVTFFDPTEGTTGVRGAKLGDREVDQLVGLLLPEVTYQPDPDDDGWMKRILVDATERRAAARTIERARRQTRRRMSDEDLHRVAETYQAADPPKHMAIAKAFFVTPRTAQRYIEKAREADFLPPSERTRK